MKRRSPPVTAEMAAIIKLLVIRYEYIQHHAAAVFGINQGRVSEVMSGKRHPNVPMATSLPPGLV